MVKWFVVLIIGLMPALSYSQFGVNIKYLFGKSETLDSLMLSQDGMQWSLEYSFGLKNKRLEFHPGIGYRFTFDSPSYDGYFYAIDLDLNTSIYPFDFGGGCDCPTFSKDGNIIKKGLFFEVSPGVSYQFLKRYLIRNGPNGQQKTVGSNGLVYKLGLGAGLDIGISDAITLTPMLTYTFLSKADWYGLNRDGDTGRLDDQAYLGAGFRIVYKPDEKRYRRRR